MGGYKRLGETRPLREVVGRELILDGHVLAVCEWRFRNELLIPPPFLKRKESILHISRVDNGVVCVCRVLRIIEHIVFHCH